MRAKYAIYSYLVYSCDLHNMDFPNIITFVSGFLQDNTKLCTVIFGTICGILDACKFGTVKKLDGC